MTVEDWYSIPQNHFLFVNDIIKMSYLVITFIFKAVQVMLLYDLV